MKAIKVVLMLSFVALIINFSNAQQNPSDTLRHSHAELEKQLLEMKTISDNADKTYQLSQETYNAAKEYEQRMNTSQDSFLKFIAIIISIFSLLGLGSIISNSIFNYISRREIKSSITEKNVEISKDLETNFNQLKNENIKHITNSINELVRKNKDTVEQMINAKVKDYYLKENSKILVINHIDTSFSEGFIKVLSLFKKINFTQDIINVNKLSDGLNNVNIERFKDVDLVIIENQEQSNQWDISGREKPNTESIDVIDENTLDNFSDSMLNKSIMVKLANNLCQNTALVYYGPGVFPIEQVDADKQHLIAFSNSPSTLYSNIMNMLKFRDVLKSN